MENALLSRIKYRAIGNLVLRIGTIERYFKVKKKKRALR